jgi:hypothetical protein
MILHVARLAAAVEPEAVQDLLRYFERRDSVEPILNPTAYRDEMTQAARARELVEAFAAFRECVEKIRAAELEELVK